MDLIYWITAAIMFILIIYTIITKIKNKQLTQRNKILISQKKSSEVRLGQIGEQLAPFLKGFKYDTRNTKFLGQPIDFISFEQDRVVFIEVKTGKSQLSTNQKRIKELINKKQVYWEEFRIFRPESNDNQNS